MDSDCEFVAPTTAKSIALAERARAGYYPEGDDMTADGWPEMLLSREITRCRHAACTELATLQYGDTACPEERTRRLLYLFQRDLLGSYVGGLLLDDKARRDAFFVDIFPERLYASYKHVIGGARLSLVWKALVVLFLLMMHAAMLLYVSWYFLDQQQQRQKAWLLSLTAWITMDLLFVSSLEVLFQHVALPLLILKDVMRVRGAVLRRLYEYNLENNQTQSYLDTRGNEGDSEDIEDTVHLFERQAWGDDNDGHHSLLNTARDTKSSDRKRMTAHKSQYNDDNLTINAAEFFFVSVRLAKFFGVGDDELAAAKFVLSYSSPLPPGHMFATAETPGQQISPSWLRPVNARLMQAVDDKHAVEAQRRLAEEELALSDDFGDLAVLPAAAPEEIPDRDWSCAERVAHLAHSVWTGAILLVVLKSYLLLNVPLQNVAVQCVLVTLCASVALLHLFLYKAATYLLFMPIIVLVAATLGGILLWKLLEYRQRRQVMLVAACGHDLTEVVIVDDRESCRGKGNDGKDGEDSDRVDANRDCPELSLDTGKDDTTDPDRVIHFEEEFVTGAPIAAAGDSGETQARTEQVENDSTQGDIVIDVLTVFAPPAVVLDGDGIAPVVAADGTSEQTKALESDLVVVEISTAESQQVLEATEKEREDVDEKKKKDTQRTLSESETQSVPANETAASSEATGSGIVASPVLEAIGIAAEEERAAVDESAVEATEPPADRAEEVIVDRHLLS